MGRGEGAEGPPEAVEPSGISNLTSPLTFRPESSLVSGGAADPRRPEGESVPEVTRLPAAQCLS
jgi:hypothetical protein